jgi:hypothetical protein
MNWKAFVNADNAKRYVLPQGWTSKADIAKELECSEERVRPFLLAAIKEGTIEEKLFVVWDAGTERKVNVTAFRKVAKPAPAKLNPSKPH